MLPTTQPLSPRAEVRRPPADLLLHHLALAALRARLAVLLEDPQVVLVLAGTVQHVPIQSHRRPPVLDPRGEVLPDRLVERPPLSLRERVRLAPGMQPRVEEDLVCVDVAHARDHLLVQDQRLYLGSPALERPTQIFYREPLLQRLRSQSREPRLELPHIEQTRPSEARLVPQEQPPASVQVEDEHHRRPRLLHRRDEQQLATDLELEDQCIPGVQLDDEGLGPSSRARDPDAIEPARELPGGGLLDERGVEHLGPFYG